MDSLEQALLTPRQAYLVMFEFLRQYYQREQSDEVGSLLGDLSLLADGSSADPAQWVDWKRALSYVLEAEATPQGYRHTDFALDEPEH